MEWCSDFARIGFVEQHKKVCLDLEMILDDSLHRFFEEKQKPPKERDDHLILLLKKDIRAGTLAFQEMSMGTPIMAELKGMLDKRAHSLNPSAAEVYPHYRKLLNQLWLNVKSSIICYLISILPSVFLARLLTLN